MAEIIKKLNENERVLWMGKSEPYSKVEDSRFWNILGFFVAFILLSIFILYFLQDITPFFFIFISITIFSVILITFIFQFYNIYINRFYGDINYSLTSDQIFIQPKEWKKGNYKYGKYYAFDNGCFLNDKVFFFNQSIGITELKKITKIQIKEMKTHYNLYFYYLNVESKDEDFFKFGGVKEIKEFLKIIQDHLNFERDFSEIQLETYIKAKNMILK